MIHCGDPYVEQLKEEDTEGNWASELPPWHHTGFIKKNKASTNTINKSVNISIWTYLMCGVFLEVLLKEPNDSNHLIRMLRQRLSSSQSGSSSYFPLLYTSLLADDSIGRQSIQTFRALPWVCFILLPFPFDVIYHIIKTYMNIISCHCSIIRNRSGRYLSAYKRSEEKGREEIRERESSH